MNAKAIIPLVAGLVVGGLALKMGFTKLNSASGAQVQMVSIWAARADIPRGTAIDETMLQALPFPAKSMPQGAFKETDKEKLLARVARIGAPANLPILDSMLLAPGEQAGIFVPDGFRAVAVKVDESSSVGRHLVPGSRVDVVGFFNVRTRDGKTETLSRTIIENVEVAAVGERISADPSPNDAAGKQSKNSTQNKPAAAVTLLVKPEQVPVLHLAEQQGKLKLSMRSKSDEVASAAQRIYKGDDLTGESRKSESPMFANALAAFFSGANKQPAAQPQPTLPPDGIAPPSAAVKPSFQWVMKIVNGGKQEVLGWRDMNSLESEAISFRDNNPAAGGSAAGAASTDPASANGVNNDQEFNGDEPEMADDSESDSSSEDRD
ncbi:MAG: Flp pilus assembly protein CpaB [Planctomycetia bacterium]|nr:MAG: Flp pilus assembly protein CpaB [Planctomycetia bacterium]